MSILAEEAFDIGCKDEVGVRCACGEYGGESLPADRQGGGIKCSRMSVEGFAELLYGFIFKLLQVKSTCRGYVEIAKTTRCNE